VTIRPADGGRDAAACAAVYAPYVSDSVISFEEEPPDAAEMARRIDGAHEWLVLERNGEVAGYAYGGVHRTRAAYRWTTEVSVYVGAAHHRTGVGRALYLELFDRLRERGFHLALAGVTLPNPASVALHEALGFRAVGVYREIGRKFGAWHDVGWWELALQPTGAQTAAGSPVTAR
jgi:phosphinothricin acetyltransferase